MPAGSLNSELLGAFLVGEKIYLRPLEESDVRTYQPWLNDPEVRVHMGRRWHPRTEHESKEWVRRLDPQRSQHFAIVARDGREHVGNCGLDAIHPFDRTAELAIVLGSKPHWNQGMGREAVSLLCAHAFGTLNLHKVWLRVSAPNERAIRCYAAVGFKTEGRLRDQEFVEGRYVDTICLGLVRGELVSSGQQGGD